MTEKADSPHPHSEEIQLIIENFRVAAGSISAQGLHARAYGLVHGKSPLETNSYLLQSFDSLTRDEKNEIISGMRELHRPNEAAKFSFGSNVKSFPGIKASELIREQLPNRDEEEAVLVAAKSKSVTEEQLDQALRASWSDNSDTRVDNLKSIAAYLGMYEVDNIKWWQWLSPEQKQLMIEHGRDLLAIK